MAPTHLGLADKTVLFAELNIAMSDAAIAMSDAKYTYWFWRPVTAIQAGGAGSPPQPEWQSLLETPIIRAHIRPFDP